MPGEAKGWLRWRQQALRALSLETQQLALELEETKAVARPRRGSSWCTLPKWRNFMTSCGGGFRN